MKGKLELISKLKDRNYLIWAIERKLSGEKNNRSLGTHAIQTIGLSFMSSLVFKGKKKVDRAENYWKKGWLKTFQIW